MNSLTAIAGVAAVLGAALVGGVFFTFSSFVMRALARLPPAEGLAAMKSINVTVLNPSFLGVFAGTAVLSLWMIVVAWKSWGSHSAVLFLAGAIFYLIGTFLVTGIGNVPLNDQLAAVAATDPAAVEVWDFYLERWTMLNTVRTAAAMISALAYTLGLLECGRV